MSTNKTNYMDSPVIPQKSLIKDHSWTVRIGISDMVTFEGVLIYIKIFQESDHLKRMHWTSRMVNNCWFMGKIVAKMTHRFFPIQISPMSGWLKNTSLRLT